ncbi:MAG: endonuclease/exonuclease/phosphatase family protein [Pseudomonadota bacterium]
MKIVSLNAWGGAMYDSFASWLPTCAADVLCLQEVTCTSGLQGWTRFDDGERELPQRANLFADVCALLPSHQGVFLCSDSGPVFDRDGNRHQQDFGLSVFVSDRLPIVGSQSSYVRGSFTDHEDWSISHRPRIAHAIRVVDRIGDRSVTIAHMHGLRDPAGKQDTPARATQAEKFAGLINDTKSKEDFVVACGDFNLLPDSNTFSVLEDRCGLVDLVGTSDTRTSKYPKQSRHANYMLVSNREAVKNFSAPAEPEVSDHRLLILDV